MTTHALVSDCIFIPGQPAIPELSFRRFRGDPDYPKMVTVIQGCKDFDHIERVDSVEDVARFYSHLVNCNPYEDMVFAEVDGQVIGYNRIDWRMEVEGNRIYRHFGFLLPEWRRKGIGGAMLRQAERRIRQITAVHPGGIPCFYESFAADSEVGCEALLRSEGYAPFRHSLRMVRSNLEDIPSCPLPPGMEIRPVQREHLDAIHAASLEAFQDHWGFSPETEPTIAQWLEDPIIDFSLWRVAWDGEQVSGMVLSFINKKENEEYNRQRGWTENICVRKPWRKNGLARALIAASLRELKVRGMTEAALGVDTDNHSGALHLYKSMGYRADKRFSIYRKSF